MNFALRVSLIAVGIVLLGLALLCYEDEEKRIQSRIEEYWVRLSDVEGPAYEWQDRLTKQVLAISNHFLNSLFGPGYLSWQFVSTSVSISSISALLLTLAVVFSGPGVLNACTVIACTGALVLLARAGTRGGWQSKVTAVAALPIMLVCDVFVSYRMQHPPAAAYYYDVADLIVAAVASLAGDVAAVWVFRKISAREFRGWTGICFGIFGAIGGALSVLAMPLLVIFVCLLVLRGWDFVAFSVMFLFELVAMDSADFILIGAVFGVALTIAVHHLAWPFMLRALYSVQRMGFSRIRAASWSLGLAMVGCGVAPSLNLKPVWELIRHQLG